MKLIDLPFLITLCMLRMLVLVNVNKGSRTLVMVNPSDDNDDDAEAPVCVLRQGQNENQSLDLLFNESATITIKGQKASTVYLSGYLQPPIDADAAGMMD